MNGQLRKSFGLSAVTLITLLPCISNAKATLFWSVI